MCWVCLSRCSYQRVGASSGLFLRSINVRAGGGGERSECSTAGGGKEAREGGDNGDDGGGVWL